MLIPTDLQTKLAWTFNTVLPGTFRRNKKDFTHHEYPVLGPLPSLKSRTRPLDDCGQPGPFIYFLIDGAGDIVYIGKSLEPHVLVRWMRPGIGGPTDYYWTHSTKRGGCVFEIAKGIKSGLGPYSLRYSRLADLMPMYGSHFGITPAMETAKALSVMESGLKSSFGPSWNIQ